MPHLDAAYRLARRLSRSPAEADDIVQEAFLRAFRGFDTLRSTDAKAWLLAIVRNCHATALRQQQHFTMFLGQACDQPIERTLVVLDRRRTLRVGHGSVHLCTRLHLGLFVIGAEGGQAITHGSCPS